MRNVQLAAMALALAAFTVQAEHNVLTKGETDAGYELIFNGKDLTSSFHTYHSTLPPPSWSVVAESSSNLIKVSSTTGGAQHLITKDTTYLNFDLKVEWRVPNSGNSGIFIHYQEINEWGGASGPEAQVVDINHPDGISQLHRAGTDYDMFPLVAGRETWWNPTGQWNQFRIISYGPHVAHYGNGRKICEYEMFSPAWNAAYAIAKYKAYPMYNNLHSGSIYFQHHGELGISYRDIRAKKLTNSQDPWANGSIYLKADKSGLIDNLTFDDNLFATPTHIVPKTQLDGRSKIRNVGGVVGASLNIGQETGEGLKILDLNGRLIHSFPLQTPPQR